MRSRSKFMIAATLSLSLFASTVAKAGPVQLNNVRQVIKGSPASGWQDGNSELRTSTPITDPITDPKTKTENTDPNKAQTPTDPTLQQEIPVRTETFEEFIEDTACDCPGEAPPITTGGGFPWWVLGAGAIPLAFIDRKKTPEDQPPGSTPTPTPTNTPPGVPEPATLLLFGSGLLALGVGARRRFRRNDDDITGQTPTIGEG